MSGINTDVEGEAVGFGLGRKSVKQERYCTFLFNLEGKSSNDWGKKENPS